MSKTKLFIDHDGTITYRNVISGKWKYKEGIKEFLDFITDNFDVSWCSLCEHFQILQSLRRMGIEESVLKKIKYFECDLPGEKARSIFEKNKDFIFIDDDGYDDEFRYMRGKGLERNFIKAKYNEENDLKRIAIILNSRIN